MLQFLISMVLTLRRTACWAGRGASERGRRAALPPPLSRCEGWMWVPAHPSSSGLRG